MIVGCAGGGSARVHDLLELEHVVEQMDGLDLVQLAADRNGVWLSGCQMFESASAIRAGRAVLAETPMRRLRSDKFVE